MSSGTASAGRSRSGSRRTTPNVLYAGGNRVFRSTDDGQSWEAISPDLTRADPDKLGPSGGPITRDTSGAEHYCTLYAFAESPHEPGVLWAGSDDGLVHLSRDGGQSWNDVTPPDLPTWAFIRTVEPSPHDPATLYLAATRYKLDDNTPYLFKTADYGESWQSITGTGGDGAIPGDDFVRVIRVDPACPGMLYVGTETGLCVSLDDGATWRRWRSNFPGHPGLRPQGRGHGPRDRDAWAFVLDPGRPGPAARCRGPGRRQRPPGVPLARAGLPLAVAGQRLGGSSPYHGRDDSETDTGDVEIDEEVPETGSDGMLFPPEQGMAAAAGGDGFHHRQGGQGLQRRAGGNPRPSSRVGMDSGQVHRSFLDAGEIGAGRGCPSTTTFRTYVPADRSAQRSRVRRIPAGRTAVATGRSSAPTPRSSRPPPPPSRMRGKRFPPPSPSWTTAEPSSASSVPSPPATRS